MNDEGKIVGRGLRANIRRLVPQRPCTLSEIRHFILRVTWLWAAQRGGLVSPPQPYCRTLLSVLLTAALVMHGRAATPAVAGTGLVEAAPQSTSILWKGQPGAGPWMWERQFESAQVVGAILQVNGDHDFVLTNSPSTYKWFGSEDGVRWSPLAETSIINERRLIRVHQLSRARKFKASIVGRNSRTRIAPIRLA